MRSVLALIAAVNPPAVAVALWPQARRRWMGVATAVAFAIALLAAAVSQPVLDGLDVTPGTFRVAAAVVLGLVGAKWLIVGTSRVVADGPADGWGRLAVPLLLPATLTPQLVMVSMAAGVDDGVVVVGAGAAAGLALAWVAAVVAKRRDVGWNAGVRFVAALAVTVALALAIDGVKTI